MIKLDDTKRALIEKVGIFHEGIGLQPAASRVLGLLYVSDCTELTFDEIREALAISKSAASNAINLLLQLNRLEYTTFAGDRKRYFRLKLSRWREFMTKEIDNLTAFEATLREVLSIRTPETKAYNQSIHELADFLNYLHSELPGLLERWEQSKKATA
ncbi:GbsR/MarR family transcriptional regulator [Pontibacter liquoris]|uniref:GbsR/MarR family transcriptional regulator n=1 Tax=Pontibacter liquoris TaxID=2905677 RepID=UPI001FA77313|nr:MarR family transcriptional regulator [Pontibacter liquoris]